MHLSPANPANGVSKGKDGYGHCGNRTSKPQGKGQRLEVAHYKQSGKRPAKHAQAHEQEFARLQHVERKPGLIFYRPRHSSVLPASRLVQNQRAAEGNESASDPDESEDMHDIHAAGHEQVLRHGAQKYGAGSKTGHGDSGHEPFFVRKPFHGDSQRTDVPEPDARACNQTQANEQKKKISLRKGSHQIPGGKEQRADACRQPCAPALHELAGGNHDTGKSGDGDSENQAALTGSQSVPGFQKRNEFTLGINSSEYHLHQAAGAKNSPFHRAPNLTPFRTSSTSPIRHALSKG